MVHDSSQIHHAVSQRRNSTPTTAGPFRLTLLNSSAYIENIPRKNPMFPQSFCGPPPMCPPFCFSPCPPCPPPCMPFPCNPCCPPYCCPPPQCCPPPCCPPSKCNCSSGNKRIISVPRSRAVGGKPSLPPSPSPSPSPSDPFKDKPACYNNCNFYGSDHQASDRISSSSDQYTKSGSGQSVDSGDQNGGDPYGVEGLNTAAGDDQIYSHSPRSSFQQPQQPNGDRSRLGVKAGTSYPSATRASTPGIKSRRQAGSGMEDGNVNRFRNPSGKLRRNLTVTQTSHIDIKGDEPSTGVTSEIKVKGDDDDPLTAITSEFSIKGDESPIGVTSEIKVNGVDDDPPLTAITSELNIKGDHPPTGVTSAIKVKGDDDQLTVISSEFNSKWDPLRGTINSNVKGSQPPGTINSNTKGDQPPGTINLNTKGDQPQRTINSNIKRGQPPGTINPNTKGAQPPATINPNTKGAQPPGTINSNTKGAQPPGTINANIRRDQPPATTNSTVTTKETPPPTEIPSTPRKPRSRKKKKKKLKRRCHSEPVCLFVCRSESHTPDRDRSSKKEKKRCSKKKKRSNGDPACLSKRKKETGPPYVAFGSGAPGCYNFGGAEKPVQTIFERDCPVPADTCDYTYRNTSYGCDNGPSQAADNCGHQSPHAVHSPCGLCHKDYDVCPTEDSQWRQKLILGAHLDRPRSSSRSPEISLTWRRETKRTRPLTTLATTTNGHVQNPRTRTRGLPMPAPPDVTTGRFYEGREERRTFRQNIQLASSSRSVNFLHGFANRSSTSYWNLEMSRSRSPTSSLRANATRSMMDVSERDLIMVESRSWSRRRSRITVPRKGSAVTSGVRKMADSFPTKKGFLAKGKTEVDITGGVDYWQGPTTAEVYLMSVRYEDDERCPKPCTRPPVPKPRKVTTRHLQSMEMETTIDVGTEEAGTDPISVSASGEIPGSEENNLEERIGETISSVGFSEPICHLLRPTTVYSPPQLKHEWKQDRQIRTKRNQGSLVMPPPPAAPPSPILQERHYSPGEFGFSSDFSDDTVIALYPPKDILVPPKPKPRKFIPRKNPSGVFENLPAALPELCKINATNVYRPHKDKQPKPSRNSHSSGLRFPPTLSTSPNGNYVDPDLHVQSGQGSAGSHRPLPPFVNAPTLSSYSPGFLPPLQGYPVPKSVLPNYSRGSNLVLPKLPNPRNKPRSLGATPSSSKPKF